jgi:hypothetical protein
MDGKELNTREFEGSVANAQQKIRFLHAAQSDLNVRRKNSLYQTPSSMRKAENDVLYHERRLGGVLEELIEEARKLLLNIDPGESAPVKRFASRGD